MPPGNLLRNLLPNVLRLRKSRAHDGKSTPSNTTGPFLAVFGLRRPCHAQPIKPASPHAAANLPTRYVRNADANLPNRFQEPAPPSTRREVHEPWTKPAPPALAPLPNRPHFKCYVS